VAIYASGEYLPSAIIYSATTGNLQTSWLEDFNPDEHTVYFASSEKGWTNDQLGFRWLELFDRYTKTKARQGHDWRILWADGHDSHLSMEFLNWSIEHRIHITVYPSHSTHRLQSLDIDLFSPLARFSNTRLPAIRRFLNTRRDARRRVSLYLSFKTEKQLAGIAPRRRRPRTIN
jgi:uncharacterized protein YndB with AHSA1/START domain